MHVSPNGPPQQVVLFLNPPLGIFPEMARVGHAGQPIHPYGCYDYRGGWWVLNLYEHNGTKSLNIHIKMNRSMYAYLQL